MKNGKNLDKLIKQVFDNEMGHQLLAELYLMYADCIPLTDSPMQQGFALGKAEMVKQLMRSVYEKNYTNTVRNATIISYDIGE